MNKIFYCHCCGAPNQIEVDRVKDMANKIRQWLTGQGLDHYLASDDTLPRKVAARALCISAKTLSNLGEGGPEKTGRRYQIESLAAYLCRK